MFPSWYHWFPAEAEEVSRYPFAVTTGVGGMGETATFNPEEVVPEPQEFVPITVMSPVSEPKSTVTEFVFVPLAIEAPGGTVQAYPVALAIGVVE